jgi:hypothetical protein
MTLHLAPQIPQVNSGQKVPIKVAVIVPESSRNLNQAAALPTGCFQMTTNPAPHGQIFVQTVQGIMEQYFDQVVMLDAPPAPKDAALVVEAALTGIGMKAACIASPDFYAEATGSFRAMDPQGHELWRDTRSSARESEGLPMAMAPYHTIMPKAMADLVSYWATDLVMSPAVRGALPDQSDERPARRARQTDDSSPSNGSGGAATPWWQQSGSDDKKN